MVGPEYGSDEYNEQVVMIKTVIGAASDTTEEAEQMALAYIYDMTFSRAAISQALKEIEQERS